MSVASLPLSARRDGAEVAEALDSIHERLAELAGCKTPEPIDPARVPAPLLFELGRRLALSEPERQTLLFAAAAELCTTTGALIRRIGHGPPTVGLAMRICDGLDWQALRPDAALRRAHLLTLGPAADSRFTERPIWVEEPVLHFLNGVTQLAPELGAMAVQVDRDHPVATDQATLEATAALLAGRESPFSLPAIEIDCDDTSEGVIHAIEALRTAGYGALVVPSARLPATSNELGILRDLWLRDSLLHGLGLVLVGDREAPAANHQMCGWTGPLMLVGFASRPTLLATQRVQIRHDAGIRVRAWEAALPAEHGERYPDQIGRLAARFRLSTPAIAAIGADHGTGGPEELWAAARDAARPRELDLIERIEPVVTLDQVILPDDAKETLATMVSAAKVHHRILAEWGGSSAGGRGLGVAALFSGESGTGKTMAAEAVARELGVDLYRVEVSAVVSKYIGETEKNLRRIFSIAEAGGGVLLFDEADTLFGKRSEVRDAHDRYANMEIGYLLQLMEGFLGLAILTTNFHDALDEAFTRRLRFTVPFPMPGAEERSRIWAGAFPRSVQLEGVEFARLARLPLSGGIIRNIALGAAFRAAAAGSSGAVTMTHILASARSEYLKIGRPPAEIDAADWS